MNEDFIKSYPRFRSRTEPVAAVNKWLDTTCSSCASRGTVKSLNTVATSKLGLYVTMDDMVTRRYRELSAEGYIIITPMKMVSEQHSVFGDYTKTSRIATSSFGCSIAPICHEEKDYRGPWALNQLNGNPLGGTQLSQMSALSQSDITAANSAAATAAWAATSAHSADVLQDVAEIRQTLNLLRNPLQNGHRFIDMVLKKRKTSVFGSAADAYSYASSMWLQYRYGVRPLVSSINGILKELTNDQRPYRNTARGKFTLYASNTVTGVLTYNASTNNHLTTIEDSYEVSCGIIMDEVVSMAQALGVDASGMLSLPWELVPFSFVADWFVNVGTFLKAVAPFVSKRPAGSWTRTTRTQNVRFMITNSVAASPSQFTLVRAANERWDSTWITTTRIPGIASPSLTLKPQAVLGVLTDLRAVDSLALLTQKLERAFRH